jgi:5,10-methenyltetrahydrofolate synthetase
MQQLNSPEAERRATVMAWRREERQRQIEARLATPVEQRQQASLQIAERLDRHCREQGLLAPGTIVSGYWPLRGEPDLRAWLARLHAEGFTCVLPVVAEKGAPLVFRRWSPGCAMEKGFWNIPVPAEPAEYTPAVLLAPVVAFDRQCYRLGYGGGYFDRTLAKLHSQRRPYHAVGVGYAAAQIESVRPLPHDIALQAVATERELVQPRGRN